MARLTSQLILSLIDRVSAPARRVAQSVRGITRAVAEGNGQRLRAVAAANRENITRLRGDLLDAAGTATVLYMALRKPISAARAFETVLTDIGQKANLSRKQQMQLGASIRALGPQVNRSAQEVAGGIDVLAGFGLDPEKALAMMRPIGIAATAYRADISDLAKSSFAAFDNLKVPINEVARALAAQAVAGKEGAFELKDMAQYFPSLTASAQALGQTGVPAVADLAAALQIVRKGAGDSAEAATNLSNVLQKINAPLTRKKFAKFGIDLEGSMKAAAAKGMTPIEAIADITNRALKGDLAKIGDLFEDAQVQKGLRPLIQNLEEYRRIRKVAAAANDDVLGKDFAERMKDSAAQADAFKARIENLSISLGSALLPGINAFLGAIAPLIDGVTRLSERFPGLTRLVVGSVAAIVALRLATLAFRFGKAQMVQGLLEAGIGLLGFKAKALATAGALGRNLVLSLVGAALHVQIFRDSLKTGGIRGMITSLLGMINPIKLVSLAFRGLLAATGIGLLVLAAGLIMQHWSGIMSFFRGFGQGFAAAIAPVRPALEPLIQGVKTVVGWVKALIGDKGEDWTSWGVKAGSAVGGFVTGAIGFVSKLVDWFKKAVAVAMDLARLTPAGLVIRAGAAVAGAVTGGRKPAGRRRHGGPVIGGQDYLVGETRAEIFRAPTSGRIHANGQSPGGSRGGSGGRGGGVFAPRIQIVGGNASPDEIAERVMARLRDEYQRFSAGSFADAGEFA